MQTAIKKPVMKVFFAASFLLLLYSIILKKERAFFTKGNFTVVGKSIHSMDKVPKVALFSAHDFKTQIPDKSQLLFMHIP